MPNPQPAKIDADAQARACLPDDVEALKALVLQRDTEIEQLKLLVAKLKRMQFGRSSERLDREVEQLELRLEELQVQAELHVVRAGVSPEKRKPVRQPLPTHLPREQIVHQGPACHRVQPHVLLPRAIVYCGHLQRAFEEVTERAVGGALELCGGQRTVASARIEHSAGVWNVAVEFRERVSSPVRLGNDAVTKRREMREHSVTSGRARLLQSVQPPILRGERCGGISWHARRRFSESAQQVGE